MPLPLIIGIAAGIAGAFGAGVAIAGAGDMVDAKKKLNNAKDRNDANLTRLKRSNKLACQAMDALGKKELDVLASFKDFSDLIEKIKNKPSFNEIRIGNVTLPKFSPEELKDASIGAAVLLGGVGSAALGTFGGFAAAGATSAAVMALGTASTGTAIASLSGVAATNATLAALGGGSLAAGGGGMALGSAILGGATLGVGLLIGGIIFGACGSNMRDKADEAWTQMKENEKKIKKICSYLNDLQATAQAYTTILSKIFHNYKWQLYRLRKIIVGEDSYASGYFHAGWGIAGYSKVDWLSLSDAEKKTVSNATLLTSVLYNMCKVKIVKKSNSDMNRLNTEEIDKAGIEGLKALDEVGD